MAIPGSLPEHGELLLDDLWIETENYQPPAYGRSLAYQDNLVVAGGQIYSSRHVVDHGPNPGIWQPFLVHCWNACQWEPDDVPFRGMAIYRRLLELANQVGVTHTLWDPALDIRYRVVFGADGMTPTYPQGFARNVADKYGNKIGDSFNVQISLLEVPEVPGIIGL